MAAQTIPIVILGGSDRRPSRLPAEGRDKHPLSGFKGVDLRIGGKPVIEIILDRLEACGAFGPIFVAGPAPVYATIESRAILIDTNDTFGRNIGRAIAEVSKRHPGTAVAFTTCDILPDVEVLAAAMADWSLSQPFDLWYPMIRVPRDRALLGASAWKPFYRVASERGQPEVELLPGHLLVADTDALRLRFIDRLLDAGYRTRNRSVLYRLTVLVGGLAGGILVQDLLHVLGGRLPTLTGDTIGAGIMAGAKLRKGSATIADLEGAIRRIFVKRRHRDRYPDRRVALPLLEGLSLALDIDTEEEAREKDETSRRTA